MKKKKVTLEKLSVESFQTNLNNTDTLKGGMVCPLYGPCITLPQCPFPKN